jgi:integrase
MKPRSFIEHKRRLELHILPALGSSKLSAVSTADIRRLHDKLSKTPVGANRVAGLVKTMFNVAVLKGCLPENHVNPANKIKPNKEQPRERFLQVEEVARLAKAIAKAEESGNESRHALAAIKLLLLTGARRDEILALEWSFVDLDGAVLNLPDSKTGKKPIYLNPGAVEVLRELEKIRTEGNPYVIEGHCHGKRLIGIHRIWERIRTSAKLAGLRLHDLRHSFASAALWNGVNLATVGKLLGHKDSRTTQRYGHIADRVAIDAAATVGTALSNMMAANVVEIGGKSHESQSNGETQS